MILITFFIIHYSTQFTESSKCISFKSKHFYNNKLLTYLFFAINTCIWHVLHPDGNKNPQKYLKSIWSAIIKWAAWDIRWYVDIAVQLARLEVVSADAAPAALHCPHRPPPVLTPARAAVAVREARSCLSIVCDITLAIRPPSGFCVFSVCSKMWQCVPMLEIPLWTCAGYSYRPGCSVDDLFLGNAAVRRWEDIFTGRQGFLGALSALLFASRYV